MDIFNKQNQSHVKPFRPNVAKNNRQLRRKDIDENSSRSSTRICLRWVHLQTTPLFRHTHVCPDFHFDKRRS
ncbi:hypothetical protein WN48_03607 [Eufriesea mexicana]|nr:hypothetical protein WN48_03607 [Eufriesea mexicana]